LSDGNRRRMGENLLNMALMDAELMKKVGLLDVARVVQKIGEKFGFGSASGIHFGAKGSSK
jgi:hypothetical protein